MEKGKIIYNVNPFNQYLNFNDPKIKRARIMSIRLFYEKIMFETYVLI